MCNKSLPMIFLAVLLSLALVTSSGLAADKVRSGTPVKGHPVFNLPMLAAQERGLFKAEGLELEWVPFASGIVMHRAVAAGALDMGMTTTTSVITAIAVGTPEIIVADTKATDDFIIIVRSDSAIREPKDLKGAKVGVTRFGTSTHAFALAAAKALGMEKDIKFVAAGGQMEQFAGIKAGSVDAVIFTRITAIPLKVPGEVREVLTLRDYLPEGDNFVFFARRDLADKNPALVKGSIRAMVKATNFVLENPEWARGKMKETLGYTDDVAKQVYTELRYGKDVRISRKGLENMVKFLTEYGIIKRETAPSVEATYTTRFTE